MRRHEYLVLVGAVLLAFAVYLATSWQAAPIGFPLDDSWIHQTYARSLALRGEWAFRPGLTSAGSTAPFWSLLLAPGHLLRLAPYAWTLALGGILLLALCSVMENAGRALAPHYRPRLPWIGLLFAFEWHLVWAALSGMETIMHALLVSVALVLLMRPNPPFAQVGVLAGLSVWVRPDGLTLAGPVLLVALTLPSARQNGLQPVLRFLLGFAPFVAIYLLFNSVLGGTPMPSTFYAKQSEYAGWWQTLPWSQRLLQLAVQVLAGPGFVLLPGALAWAWHAARRRDVATLAATLWVAGYMILYLARLPVYQHGRYVMPAIPMLFLLGLLGLIQFGSKQNSTLVRLTTLTWRTSLALLCVIFVALGARSYAEDVAFIESEMVAAARWSADHLPADALVAAHDIGALGYFDGHALIDLAGLISPDVIPFMRDEERIASFLGLQGADFLVAFPDFYPRLTRELEPVFVSPGSTAPVAGHGHMTVYRLDTDE